MARHVGAGASWTPSNLPQETAEITARLEHPEPVMQKVAFAARDEAISRLTSGASDWPPKTQSTIERWGNTPLGVGEHGGFVSSVRAFWDARGAGWFTRAPHAHFFDEGTATHFKDGTRIHVYSSSKRHVSRAETRKRLRGATSEGHQPARAFAYLSDELIKESGERVTNFFLTGDLG